MEVVPDSEKSRKEGGVGTNFKLVLHVIFICLPVEMTKYDYYSRYAGRLIKPVDSRKKE